MSLTYQEAIDEISTMFKDATDPLSITVHYEGVREQRDKTVSPWASFVIRHATGDQESLGGLGFRSFRREGVLIASVFGPIGNGLSESISLAKTIADAYEGKSSPSGVWFRNVRIQEIGREGDFFQVNALADFQYQETK